MCRLTKPTAHEKQTLAWFLERVGKRIKRLNGNRKCVKEHCIEARTSGLVVHSKVFAEYLWEVQEYQHYRYGDMDIVIISSPNRINQPDNENI
jgi:hypothetical protein